MKNATIRRAARQRARKTGRPVSVVLTDVLPTMRVIKDNKTKRVLFTVPAIKGKRVAQIEKQLKGS